MEWCGENGISFSIIFTKSDKLKTVNSIENNIKVYQKILLETWEELPNLYITSAERKTGGEEILKYIKETNDFLIQNKINFNK